MKFLCPSCKAKYQIADEKVAGRSVRMKCRKCGFMIQVTSAMGTPGSGDSEPPDVSGAEEASVATPPVREPSSPVAAPLQAAVRPAPPSALKPPQPRTAAVPAPRSPPARAGGALAKPFAPAAQAVASTASASSPTAAAAQPAALATDPLRSPGADDEVTRVADAGALAGAFTQAFGRGDAAVEPDARLSMPGDEWFVGINGVPVGPIRLSELRSKATSGAVTDESLVWRDGFEDWRPLKTYPELLAIVEEGVSSARASLTPFTPPASEARDFAAGSGVTTVAADARGPSPGAVTGSALVTDEIAGVPPPSRGTSPMVWVAMVIAIALGVTLGFVLFGGQKPGETRIVEKIVEVPAKEDERANVAAAASPSAGEPLSTDPQAPRRNAAVGKAPSATPEGEGKPLAGLKGLTGLSGLGPSGGPTSGGPSGTTGGGGQLDGGQIQSTVARYTGSVKRRCWQPALDARAKDAPMTAKVTVTITVGGTGSVQSATTSGDARGYSGLANCIASSVRAWQFPASGGTTIANVPFVFAGQ